MLTYIYLNVDECSLTSSMHQQMFKLQDVFNNVKCNFEVVLINTNLLTLYKHK